MLDCQSKALHLVDFKFQSIFWLTPSLFDQSYLTVFVDCSYRTDWVETWKNTVHRLSSGDSYSKASTYFNINLVDVLAETFDAIVILGVVQNNKSKRYLSIKARIKSIEHELRKLFSW